MRKILFITMIIGLFILPKIIKNPLRPHVPQIERVFRLR